jgi:micrococcal nuclease
MTILMPQYAMSRRRRSFMAILFAMAALAVFALDHSCVRQAPLKPSQSVSVQSSTDIEKYDGKQFNVVKVVDGDTLDIDIPDASGEKAYPHTRIRLWGVDTPETKDPRTGPMYFGKEASEFSTTKALSKKVTVYLEKDRNTRDKYHRLLAYIQLPDGKFLNEELLSGGYAYADSRFKHSFFNKYKQLEALARSQKRGLWAGVTPEQMPKWKQKRTKSATEISEVNN